MFIYFNLFIYYCIWLLVTVVMLFDWTHHRIQFWKCIHVATKKCDLYCMVQRFPRVNSLKIGNNCLQGFILLYKSLLLVIREHPSSPPVFSGVRVTRSLVLYVFVDHCLSYCTFSFSHLCCLFFDIRILITPLTSSNSSYKTSQENLKYTKPLSIKLSSDFCSV